MKCHLWIVTSGGWKSKKNQKKSKSKEHPKAIVKQASTVGQHVSAHLCKVARFVEPSRVGHYLRSKPAKDVSLRSSHSAKNSTNRRRQVLQARMEPNTVKGPVDEMHIFHLGNDRGPDVLVPGTVYPGQKVRVNVCANEAQNCRRAV